MEGIEYNTWVIQQQYWEQKLENAQVEYEILKLKLKKAQGF